MNENAFNPLTYTGKMEFTVHLKTPPLTPRMIELMREMNRSARRSQQRLALKLFIEGYYAE